MKNLIIWLERQIEGCDNLGGMEKEKWAFIQTLKKVRKEAINYSRCCKSDSEQLKDKDALSFEEWIEHNYREGKQKYYSLNGLNCLSYEEVLQKYNIYKKAL